jgi:hypothetical protein
MNYAIIYASKLKMVLGTSINTG